MIRKFVNQRDDARRAAVALARQWLYGSPEYAVGDEVRAPALAIIERWGDDDDGVDGLAEYVSALDEILEGER